LFYISSLPCGRVKPSSQHIFSSISCGMAVKAEMKRIVQIAVVLAAWLAASSVAHAQGRVIFGNGPTTRTTNTDYFPAGALFGPASTWDYGLYIGPAGATYAQLSLVGLETNPVSTSATDARAGLMTSSNPYALPTSPFNGVATDGSAPIAVQVRLWEASLGSSYEAALVAAMGGGPVDQNTYFSVSVIGQVVPTVVPAGAAPIFGTGPGLLSGIVVGIIPEPSTLALGGLGAGLWWYLRRRLLANGGRRPRV
jgi:hypothetical protein